MRLELICLSVIALVAVGVVLKQAQSVILPLFIAWLLSYILGPIVTTLQRRRVPVALSVTLVLVLLVGVCYLVIMFLQGRVMVFAAAFPRYEPRISELIASIGARFPEGYQPWAEVNWGARIQTYLMRLAGFAVDFMSKLIVVVFFLVFLLLGKPFFQHKIRVAFSPVRAEQVIRVMSSISGQIGRYLTVQFIISLTTGVLVWLALNWIGVDFAVTWGALAFILNFIPTLGSIVASVPPILLALVQFDKLWPAIVTLLAILAIQMTMGNVVAPKVMGDQLNLSPVVVLLSLVFWGWLWGIVGALLSVPIASAIKIVCENIGFLRPIGILMGSGKMYGRQPPIPAA